MSDWVIILGSLFLIPVLAIVGFGLVHRLAYFVAIRLSTPMSRPVSRRCKTLNPQKYSYNRNNQEDDLEYSEGIPYRVDGGMSRLGKIMQKIAVLLIPFDVGRNGHFINNFTDNSEQAQKQNAVHDPPNMAYQTTDDCTNGISDPTHNPKSSTEKSGVQPKENITN